MKVMKTGRPKGLKIATCVCGWRVTGKGKSATCPCGKRIVFDRRRPRPSHVFQKGMTMKSKSKPTAHQKVLLSALKEELDIGLITFAVYLKRGAEIMANE